MPAITSTGLGSGLKINDIVTGILDAEKVPVQSQIDRDAALATAQISALGSINSALSTFKDSYKDLSKTSTFSAVNISSSDESVVTAKANIGAQTGVFDITVKQKAESHSVASGAFASPFDDIGTGTLTIRFGSYTSGSFVPNADATNTIIAIHSDNLAENPNSDGIPEGPANNTLSTFRDSINANEENGLSASLINDGNGYRLVLTSDKTGENYAMVIVASEDADNDDLDNNTGISRLNYNDNNKYLTQTVAAADAIIIMNGITINRDSNTIDSVITGVELNILDSKPDENIRLNINVDSSSVETEIKDFVENYNKLITQLNEFSNADGANGEEGVLVGDATVRTIENQLRNILNNRMDHLPGSIKSFANLGIFTNRDGTLEINETLSYLPKFSEVLKDNLADVADFFTATGTTTDGQINFVSTNSATEPGTYTIEVTKLATQGSLTLGATLPADFSTTPFVINESNNSFIVRTDLILSNEIKLTKGSYTSESALIAEIQSQINSDATLKAKGISVNVAIENQQLVISSNTYGSSSVVAFTSLDKSISSNVEFDFTSPPVDISSTSTFDISVGGALGSIDIQGSYTTEDEFSTALTAEILSQTGETVTVSFIDNKFVISSEDKNIVISNLGTTVIAELGVEDTSNASDLGLSIIASAAGVNTEGKIDGVEAFGDGQFLLSESGDSTGMKIEILGGAIGSRGSVSFSEGTTVLLNELLLSIIDKKISSASDDVNSSSVENAPVSTLLDAKTDALYKKLEQLDRQDEDLKLRMDKYEARLYKQFNAMDSAVASLNGTLNSLTSMLEQLPGYTRDK